MAEIHPARLLVLAHSGSRARGDYLPRGEPACERAHRGASAWRRLRL